VLADTDMPISYQGCVGFLSCAIGMMHNKKARHLKDDALLSAPDAWQAKCPDYSQTSHSVQ
jgi:hypothetical protein